MCDVCVVCAVLLFVLAELLWCLCCVMYRWPCSLCVVVFLWLVVCVFACVGGVCALWLIVW